MINHYTDHAANERTYLAWLRTALALVAFGVMLERFDLFLRTFAQSLGQEKLLNLSPAGRDAGIVLVALGLMTIITATFRFSKTAHTIQSEKIIPYSIRSSLLMGVVFSLIALFILLYVSRLLSTS
jgi:putative membrane protein